MYINRIKKYKYIVFIFLLFVTYQLCQNRERANLNIPKEGRSKLKEKPFDTAFFEAKYAEPVFENLNMIGTVNDFGIGGKSQIERLYGMILRTLRFQNIITKVEEKYGLPENILAAMIMQESGGVDLLPNSADDGGIGLCHMQPSVAAEFGLKIYNNCRKLKSKKHGRELRLLIKEFKTDRKKLIQYDDRFHPLINIDAAGRMMAYYMSGNEIMDSPLESGLYRYAGKYNYSTYQEQVFRYQELLNDDDVIDAVEDEFNLLNPDLKINGQPADFDDYIEIHIQQTHNYGIENYK